LEASVCGPPRTGEVQAARGREVVPCIGSDRARENHRQQAPRLV